jgi:hypothetical protein
MRKLFLKYQFRRNISELIKNLKDSINSYDSFKSEHICDKLLLETNSSFTSLYYKAITEHYFRNSISAKELLVESLNIKDDFIEAQIALANIYLLDNYFENSKRLFEKVLLIDENNHFACFGMAIIYH